jgi:5'-nucleotidase
MNILVSNVDGYECEGIKALAAALRGLGHRVLVIAPDRERSGASHSISLAAGYIDVKKIAADTWICGGTPVDCVLAALTGGVAFDADLVVSGINAGCNLGTDILFSGTAAAAREGALNGIPSIAFSLVGEAPFFWEEAAAWAASHIEWLAASYKKGGFINVNMPNIAVLPGEPLITFPSKRQYADTVSKEDLHNGWTRLNFDGMRIETSHENGSDYEALCANTVSVSHIAVEPCAMP